MANQIENHKRINDTIIAVLEKKALAWLAARMPTWVVPDTLTAIGFFASILIFIGYALSYFNPVFLWLSSLGFMLNWFGDSLDGTLARYRKIERPRYGFFVDHMIDSVSTVLIFIGLGLSPFLRFDLALLTLICYLLISIYVYLSTYVNGEFRISYMGFGPTEMRLIAIAANTIVFFIGNPSFNLAFANLTLYDLFAVALIISMLIIFLVSSTATARALSEEDRKAHRAVVRKKKAARVARSKALREEPALRRSVIANTVSQIGSKGKLQMDKTNGSVC